MIPVLLDHNIRYYLDLFQGTLLFESIGSDIVQFIALDDVGLSNDSTDLNFFDLIIFLT